MELKEAIRADCMYKHYVYLETDGSLHRSADFDTVYSSETELWVSWTSLSEVEDVGMEAVGVPKVLLF